MNSRYRRVVPRSASFSPTAATDHPGNVISNRDAAGAVTYTLPTPGQQYLGFELEFVNVRDQTMTIAGKTAGDLCTVNNAAASSVAAQTAGQKIGARFRALCVETVSGTFKWLVSGQTVGITYTVA